MADPSARKRAIYTNILFFSGLALMGSGLFFWFGTGPALAIPGVVLVGIGIYGALR